MQQKGSVCSADVQWKLTQEVPGFVGVEINDQFGFWVTWLRGFVLLSNAHSGTMMCDFCKQVSCTALSCLVPVRL